MAAGTRVQESPAVRWASILRWTMWRLTNPAIRYAVHLNEGEEQRRRGEPGRAPLPSTETVPNCLRVVLALRDRRIPVLGNEQPGNRGFPETAPGAHRRAESPQQRDAGWRVPLRVQRVSATRSQAPPDYRCWLPP